MDDEDHIEHTLFVNREVKVYRIPPRPAAGGHSSGTWRVDDLIFTGRMRIMARGQAVEIRLEDNNSGELFALCPFTPATQAVCIEPAVDSSRYYVLRVEDPGTRRHAFLGVGFGDRGAAFDFNAALADHAKQCQRESIVASHAAAVEAAHHQQQGDHHHQQQHGGGVSSTGTAAAAAGGGSWQHDPAFDALYRDPGDLRLKEGQTIRIDVKRPSSKSGSSGFLASRDGSSGGGSSGSAAAGLAPPPVLPPPPGQPLQTFTTSPAPSSGAATATAAGGGGPGAVTVASAEENWATFD